MTNFTLLFGLLPTGTPCPPVSPPTSVPEPPSSQSPFPVPVLHGVLTLRPHLLHQSSRLLLFLVPPGPPSVQGARLLLRRILLLSSPTSRSALGPRLVLRSPSVAAPLSRPYPTGLSYKYSPTPPPPPPRIEDLRRYTSDLLWLE